MPGELAPDKCLCKKATALPVLLEVDRVFLVLSRLLLFICWFGFAEKTHTHTNRVGLQPYQGLDSSPSFWPHIGALYESQIVCLFPFNPFGALGS